MQELINESGSKLLCVPNFTPDFYSLFSDLKLEIEPPIVVRGKQCRQRRNIGFFSDESIGYKYSNQIIASQKLSDHDVLVHLLTKVNNYLGTSFNGILVNEYIDGSKYISAHSDKDDGLDKNGTVACLSYGATRIFRVRNKSDKTSVLDYHQSPGTLLVMQGDFQKVFTHEIPQQLKVQSPRISFTFRKHLM